MGIAGLSSKYFWPRSPAINAVSPARQPSRLPDPEPPYAPLQTHCVRKFGWWLTDAECAEIVAVVQEMLAKRGAESERAGP